MPSMSRNKSPFMNLRLLIGSPRLCYDAQNYVWTNQKSHNQKSHNQKSQQIYRVNSKVKLDNLQHF